MTCFWDGILSSLDENDFQVVNEKKYNTVKTFVDLLKRLNRKTVNVTWNGEPLTDRQLDENSTAIEAYDKNNISSGYLCSTCDPFLLLIAEVFKINIQHKYLGRTMSYAVANHRKTVNYTSDGGHFANANAGLLPQSLTAFLPSLPALPSIKQTVKYSAYISLGLVALKLITKKNKNDLYNGTNATNRTNGTNASRNPKKRV